MKNNLKIALAPLAGVGDSAFRLTCKKYGADIVTTEMVSAKAIHYNDKKTESLLSFIDSEYPIGIQLFGSDPDIMAESAKRIEQLSPSFIDINMGCPVPKIVNNGEGSALMKNPSLAGEIINKIVKAVNVPVSVKFRLGFDNLHINAIEFAKMCEYNGASSITVHGRTREQMYSGKANWEMIKQVKKSVSISVYGNGDIFTPEDALNMLTFSGCDGIAVARGCLGNPFIFKQIKDFINNGSYDNYSVRDRLTEALSHVRLMCDFKGEHIAIPEARKHMAWYFKGMKNSTEFKNRIFKAKEYKQIYDIINEYLDIRGDSADGLL